MPKINAGGATGGAVEGGKTHSDFPGYIEKTEQANGRVPFKVTSHMTGNNSEGIVGGIDNRGMQQANKEDGFRKVRFHDGHPSKGGVHKQY